MPSIYVDKDMQIVAAGDARTAFLAWREGGSLDEQRLDAMRPGLAKEVKAAIAAQKAKGKEAEPPKEEPAMAEEKAAEEPVEYKAAEKVENKAVEKPAENKSARSPKGE